MKITENQLRLIIKGEVNRVLKEVAAKEIQRILSADKLSDEDAKKLSQAKEEMQEVVKGKELLSIAQQVRRMVKSNLTPSTIVSYLDEVMTGDLKDIIEVALLMATPEQKHQLEYKVNFGVHDPKTAGYGAEKITKHPLNSLEMLRQTQESTEDMWIIAVQLQVMHDIISNIVKKLPTLTQDQTKPSIGTPKRFGGLLGLFAR